MRRKKPDMNTWWTVQAYLIGTVNTIQSIQCSENTSVDYQMEHKWKSAKTHHLVDLTKEKKVLLWKADKVMVRLSIVKIEVWPFKTLFIYSYILSLWFHCVVFYTVQAGYCGALLTGRFDGEQVAAQPLAPLEMSSASPGLSCYMIQKVRLIFWDTEWQAVKSKYNTSKLSSAGIPSQVQTACLIYIVEYFEMASSKTTC